MSPLDGAIDVRFYKGQIRADQPRVGYRAGTDAALLAASINAKDGSKILELGCGTGIVLLMADYRLKGGGEYAGLENNLQMLELARFNTGKHENIEINEGTVAEIPKSWHLQFDQVITNPPYFENPDAVRMSTAKAPSFVSDTSLEDWIGAMLKTLKPRGYGTIIYRADGLEKILHALHGQAGQIRILSTHSYEDEPAKRVLVRFRKGVKSESAILPPLILHDRDGESRYTEKATQILCGELPINMDV